MSASTLFVLALSALALGVVVFALGLLARYRGSQQQAQVMERALQHQPLALAAIALALRFVRDDPRDRDGVPLDLLGGALATLAWARLPGV